MVLGTGRALALAAALAAAVPVAACTSAPASPGAGPRSGASPAVTAAQAGQVWAHYAAVSAQAVRSGDQAPVLALETGPQRASDAAAVQASPAGAGARGGSGYSAPAFFLPGQSGYPRFFVAGVTRRPAGDAAAAAAPDPAGGPPARQLKLFEQAAAGAPWLLASTSELAAGVALPKLATDGDGHVPVVTPTAALLAQPQDIGPLQAAVVDDGPASAASKVVAAGELTTGLYQAARDHAGGMTAPRGDVYQWELDGAGFPEFALRTAAGGALVFYAMSLSTTVAVPDLINKADPVRPGPPIPVPAGVRALLPAGQGTPLTQLRSQRTLSFAAVDPVPSGSAKIQVIAGGGGLTSAAAT